MAMKGVFKPRYPKKYRGNVSNIIYRSSWELRLMIFLDTEPLIEWWSSEEHVVMYTDHSTNPPRMRRYFPDFLVKKTMGDTFMIEVKPEKEVLPPISRSKQTRAYIKEIKTFAKNNSKWESARRFCEQRGWKFLVLTERDLFGGKFSGS